MMSVLLCPFTENLTINAEFEPFMHQGSCTQRVFKERLVSQINPISRLPIRAALL